MVVYLPRSISRHSMPLARLLHCLSSRNEVMGRIRSIPSEWPVEGSLAAGPQTGKMVSCNGASSACEPPQKIPPLRYGMTRDEARHAGNVVQRVQSRYATPHHPSTSRQRRMSPRNRSGGMPRSKTCENASASAIQRSQVAVDDDSAMFGPFSRSLARHVMSRLRRPGDHQVEDHQPDSRPMAVPTTAGCNICHRRRGT